MTVGWMSSVARLEQVVERRHAYFKGFEEEAGNAEGDPLEAKEPGYRTAA